MDTHGRNAMRFGFLGLRSHLARYARSARPRLRLYPEARVRRSRGRVFLARAFPAPFGLGARFGGRSRGPYTSEHKSHL